jgi:hypothetical protein
MPFTNFGTPREKQAFTSTFKKVEFLDMNSTSTIRILTNGYLPILTHYINKVTVQCIGEGCPVCSTNRMLMMQFPDTFKDEPKYSPRRVNNLVNVLDKTMVRVCPKCQSELRTNGLATSPCKCGEILTGTPTPSLKVKVLSRGVTLFDQLDAINNAILDDKGERIGLTGYDITFVISGASRNKVITPLPGQVSPMPEYKEADLYDLDKVTLKLTETELVDLQSGVSLKDIFSARKASEKSSSIAESVLPKELMDSVQSDVDALFGKVEG